MSWAVFVTSDHACFNDLQITMIPRDHSVFILYMLHYHSASNDPRQLYGTREGSPAKIHAMDISKYTSDSIIKYMINKQLQSQATLASSPVS